MEFYSVMNNTMAFDQCVDRLATTMFETVSDQQMTYSIIMKVSSFLSMIGSSYIVMDACCRGKKLRNPYYRIIVGMSIYDVIGSVLGPFMNSWMVPAYTEWWGAAGNERTCTAQGVVSSFAMVAVLGYIALLSFYYWFRVSYKWTDSKFVRYFESWGHVIIFLVACAYAIPSIPLKLNAPNCDWYACVPTGYPQEQETFWLTVFPPPSQLQADYAYMIVLGAFMTISNLIAWTALFTVYCSVRKEQRKDKANNNDVVIIEEGLLQDKGEVNNSRAVDIQFEDDNFETSSIVDGLSPDDGEDDNDDSDNDDEPIGNYPVKIQYEDDVVETSSLIGAEEEAKNNNNRPPIVDIHSDDISFVEVNNTFDHDNDDESDNKSDSFEDENIDDDERRNNNLQLQDYIRLRNDLFFYVMAMHISLMLPMQIYQLFWVIGGGAEGGERILGPMGEFLKTTFYFLFLPSHGFWNMLAYIRPRFYNQQQQQHKKFLLDESSKETAPLALSDTIDSYPTMS